MTFEKDGFLSPDLNKWTTSCHLKYAEWFKLINDLNNLGMKALFEAKPAKSNDKQLIGSILFARALQSFQSSVLLAERGLRTDANTLIRSCAESTIALAGLNCVDNFIERLISDHFRHRQKLANSILNDQEYLSHLSQSNVVDLKELIARVKTLYPQDPVCINWEEIARKSGVLVIYNTIYRELSGNSAHATLDSLESHVTANAQGDIERLFFSPKCNGVDKVCSDAINTFLFAGMFLINIFELNDIETEWRNCFQQWKILVDK